MPDWKEMYLTLIRDTEKAIRILEESQKKCEELYLQDDRPTLIALDSAKKESVYTLSLLILRTQRPWSHAGHEP